MKRPLALVRLGIPSFCPDDWVIVQRWMAGCVVRGRIVVRYASGVVADVVSVRAATPQDLRHSTVEVYDWGVVSVFQRLTS